MCSNGPSWLGIPAVVAHQGGWDEILLVAGPIAVVIALLWIAKVEVPKEGVKDNITADDLTKNLDEKPPRK